MVAERFKMLSVNVSFGKANRLKSLEFRVKHDYLSDTMYILLIADRNPQELLVLTWPISIVLDTSELLV